MVTALASMALAAHTRPGVPLEQSLRLYRAEQAYMRAIPASNVYGDKLLKKIISTRPNTLKQLLGIKGIGTTRFQNYGRDIVRMINIDIKARKSDTQRATAKAAGAPRIKPVKLPRPRPRPRPRPKPKPKPRPRPSTAKKTPAQEVSTDVAVSLQPLPNPPPTSVYILELECGRVYVGSSTNVKRRINQHKAGLGSAYTRLYKPTGVVLPRLGNVQGSGDAAERDETLRYMHLRGIPLVRGWKFTQVNMASSDFDEAEANIRELYDLCRRCGRSGHFMTHCTSIVDRWGRACKKCIQ